MSPSAEREGPDPVERAVEPVLVQRGVGPLPDRAHPQRAGSVPGVLAYRAIHSGLVAPNDGSLPVQVVHQSVVV